MRTELAVTIGGWGRCYVLVETNAPPRYDGFGTLEIYDSESETGERRTPRDRSDADQSRFVLVDVEHLEWQQGRYSSGLFVHQVVDKDLTQWVQEKLYERLMGGGE